MIRILFFAIFYFFTQAILIGQNNSFEIMEHKLDSLVELGIDSMAFPGAQILVRYKDSIIFHKTWGNHKYGDTLKVKKEDIYDLASITKVATGLPVIMKLYSEGKLNLDTPVKEYFKPLKRSNKKNLTLREVLAHQAQLQPYIVFWQNTIRKNGKFKCKTFRDRPSKKFTIRITDSLYLHKNYIKKMRKEIRKTSLRPVKEYVYSGLTFLLMPDMIEDLAKQNMEQYLYDNIYKPIGVRNLVYHPLQHYPPEQIIPTEYDSLWRHQLVHGTVHDEAAAMLNGVSCNAGLFGNAEDLSVLFQLYLNKGNWKENQIIPSEIVQEFISYQYENNRRGLGFDKPQREYDLETSYVAKDVSSESFGHTGFTGTMVWADPKYDLVFVLLSNRVYPSRSHQNLYKMSLRPKMQQAVYNYILTLNQHL